MSQSPTNTCNYMHSKAIFVNVGRLSISSLTEVLQVRELLELHVCTYIKEYIENMWYMHLPVAYHGETYLLETNPCNYNLSNVLSEINQQAIDDLGRLLKRAIAEAIDEFNIFFMSGDRTVLNFSSCLINRNQFILSIDVLERS